MNNTTKQAAQQLLRDPDSEPTSELIAEGLGAANAVFVKFIDGLEEHAVGVNWSYYNDGKAWLGKAHHRWTTARGTQKEVTAFWLSIWDGFFRVSLFVPEKARADALSLTLSNKTAKMIENAKPMGKLKFFSLVFDLNSTELFDDIYTLVDFRITIR
jgi:hypothetical protein